MSTKKLKNEAQIPDRLFHEKRAVSEGYPRVAGIDEAGRGPLAGPVVAAAVVIRDADFISRIDDSKRLSLNMRQKAYLEILEKCDIGVGIVAPAEIDRINIFNATLLAMKKAVDELEEKADYLLIDGRMNIATEQPRKYLISGESKSLSIAAASIVAKVTRDRIMLVEDERYPEYGFAAHKGYGTKMHLEAVRRKGFSPIHRRTFGPFGKKVSAEAAGPVKKYSPHSKKREL